MTDTCFAVFCPANFASCQHCQPRQSVPILAIFWPSANRLADKLPRASRMGFLPWWSSVGPCTSNHRGSLVVMPIQHIMLSILGIVCAANLGCQGCFRGGYGLSGPAFADSCASCGVADTCASCGVADYGPGCGVADTCASCGVADYDPSCGVADASCGVADGCGSGVGCGTPVLGNGRVLQRLRNLICGVGYGGSETYYSEWHSDPPSQCENCDRHGNYTGGSQYNGANRRRRYITEQHQNLSDELRFADQGEETTYR